jgi:hypothetical protein
MKFIITLLLITLAISGPAFKGKLRKLTRSELEAIAIAAETYDRQKQNVFLLGGLGDYIKTISKPNIIEIIQGIRKRNPEMNLDILRKVILENENEIIDKIDITSKYVLTEEESNSIFYILDDNFGMPFLETEAKKDRGELLKELLKFSKENLEECGIKVSKYGMGFNDFSIMNAEYQDFMIYALDAIINADNEEIIQFIVKAFDKSDDIAEFIWKTCF